MLDPRIHKVIYSSSGKNWDTLFNCVQKDSATNLRRQKAKNAEERKINWTTRRKYRCMVQ